MKIYTLLLLVCYLFYLQSCRPELPTPGPCAGKAPVTADFHIYENLGTPYPDGWEIYDTDTIATSDVTFVALEEGAEYEWTFLGTKRITGKNFYQTNFPRGKLIKVSLRVAKAPDKTCFPLDSGVSIKTRKFYTTPYGNCEHTLRHFKGRFRGYRSDNSDESVVLEIDPCFRPPNQDPTDIAIYTRIIDLEPGCDLYRFGDNFWAYKQIYFRHYWKCNRPVGIMRIHGISNDNLTIEYSIEKEPNSSERISKTFKGIRITN